MTTTWWQMKCPSTYEQIFLNVIYTYNKYYSALTNKEIPKYAITGMNLEEIMLSETSQSQKDKLSIIP